MLRPFVLLALFLVQVQADAGPRWRWSNPAPHGNNIVDMACNNGLVVQVAERGQIFTSLDFDNWTPRDSHTTYDLQAVTFFGNRAIVTGENGTALYSDDGVNFVYTNLVTSDWLIAVAASPSLVVAVGDERQAGVAADIDAGDGYPARPIRRAPEVFGHIKTDGPDSQVAAGNTDDRGVGTEQGRARRTGVPGDPVCGRPRRHRCPEVAGRNLNPARRCTDEAHEPCRPVGEPIEEPASGRER